MPSISYIQYHSYKVLWKNWIHPLTGARTTFERTLPGSNTLLENFTSSHRTRLLSLASSSPGVDVVKLGKTLSVDWNTFRECEGVWEGVERWGVWAGWVVKVEDNEGEGESSSTVEPRPWTHPRRKIITTPRGRFVLVPRRVDWSIRSIPDILADDSNTTRTRTSTSASPSVILNPKKLKPRTHHMRTRMNTEVIDENDDQGDENQEERKREERPGDKTNRNAITPSNSTTRAPTPSTSSLHPTSDLQSSSYYYSPQTHPSRKRKIKSESESESVLPPAPLSPPLLTSQTSPRRGRGKTRGRKRVYSLAHGLHTPPPPSTASTQRRRREVEPERSRSPSLSSFTLLPPTSSKPSHHTTPHSHSHSHSHSQSQSQSQPQSYFQSEAYPYLYSRRGDDDSSSNDINDVNNDNDTSTHLNQNPKPSSTPTPTLSFRTPSSATLTGTHTEQEKVESFSHSKPHCESKSKSASPSACEIGQLGVKRKRQTDTEETDVDVDVEALDPVMTTNTTTTTTTTATTLGAPACGPSESQHEYVSESSRESASGSEVAVGSEVGFEFIKSVIFFYPFYLSVTKAMQLMRYFFI